MHNLFKDKERRVIIALDTPIERAKQLIPMLAPHAAGFKVGFRHISSGNANELIKIAREHNSFFFYDGKFKDIPNTVIEAVGELNALRVDMCNVHCRGGIAMMRAAKETADKRSPNPMFVIGVTLLTSLTYDDLWREEVFYQFRDNDAEKKKELQDYVVNLAGMAKEANLAGVVASPQETAAIRQAWGDDFGIVTPAVKASDGKAGGDQKRTGSVYQAIKDGSTLLVAGRPVYDQPDPVSALLKLNAEVAQALAEKEKTEQQKGAVAK